MTTTPDSTTAPEVPGPSAFEHPLIHTYRELLRVERGADEAALKRAYRAMAKVYHPDANPDDSTSSVFLRIREAYQVLSDPARVERLNREYTDKRYTRTIVKRARVQVGSFFGHRPAVRRRRRADPADLEWWGENRPTVEMDLKGNLYYGDEHAGDMSILDHPKLDLVEVIFAGRLNTGDEYLLAEAFRRRDFSALPWFVLNNEGLVHFLDGRYEEAAVCYEALNQRIGDNIVFLFRLGLCYEILAFEKAWRLPFLHPLPRPDLVQSAVRCFRRAIQLGTERPYLPQRCMTIRKTLADLLEASGRRWSARALWRNIRALEPENPEAEWRLEKIRSPIRALLGE